ncbi:MAG: signal peptidase I [Sulfuriferula sp.]|nr:signal peptidase I [Sulfuriferula sp.]
MKNWIKNNRSYLILLICFGVFRTAIADWNPIPSGSMRPNLLEGDVVFVDRLAYDIKIPLTDIIVAHIADPKRGDIVTFSSPTNGTRLIKRIVALPGDRVEMRDEVLFINGRAAKYDAREIVSEPIGASDRTDAMHLTETVDHNTRQIQLLPALAARNSFGPIIVPQGNYLMLGDNRDNSADSRYFGFVPRNLLIGQAKRILVSANIKGDWMPRTERFGQRLQ